MFDFFLAAGMGFALGASATLFLLYLCATPESKDEDDILEGHW